MGMAETRRWEGDFMTCSDPCPVCRGERRGAHVNRKHESLDQSRINMLLPRFWKKVETEPNSGCWIWVGGRTGVGYGALGFGGGRPEGLIGAHVFAYLAFRGPISHGLEIDHLCRMRWCVNPQHMELVTRRINSLRGARWTPQLWRWQRRAEGKTT